MNCIREFATMDNVLFALYLIWISVQDLKDMQVVRYSHLLGVTAVGWNVIANGFYSVGAFLTDGTLAMHFMEIAVVLLLQTLSCIFKCYGLADALTICLCSIFYFFKSNRYQCVLFSLLLQSVSGVLLIVVQIFKDNIKGLQLKQAVPYVPYISVAFFLTKWVL